MVLVISTLCRCSSRYRITVFEFCYPCVHCFNYFYHFSSTWLSWEQCIHACTTSHRSEIESFFAPISVISQKCGTEMFDRMSRSDGHDRIVIRCSHTDIIGTYYIAPRSRIFTREIDSRPESIMIDTERSNAFHKCYWLIKKSRIKGKCFTTLSPACRLFAKFSPASSSALSEMTLRAMSGFW